MSPRMDKVQEELLQRGGKQTDLEMAQEQLQGPEQRIGLHQEYQRGKLCQEICKGQCRLQCMAWSSSQGLVLAMAGWFTVPIHKLER